MDSPFIAQLRCNSRPYLFHSYAGNFHGYGGRNPLLPLTYFTVTLEILLFYSYDGILTNFSLSSTRLKHQHITSLKNRENVYAKSVYFEPRAR